MTLKSRLRENIVSLYAVQGVNYLLPLLVVPYLVRVLGPERFGLIAFAQAFTHYFIVLTDYGFNLSATRDITHCRDQQDEVVAIFSAVMIVKLGMLITCFFLMVLIVLTSAQFRTDWPIYFCSFLAVLGHVLLPAWFYQGMEQIKRLSIFNIIGKISATVGIFLLVKGPQDYLLTVVLQSSGVLLSGVLALLGVTKLGIKNIVIPNSERVHYTIKNGWPIFLSTSATTLYTSSNTFLLGLFCGNTAVAYFSAAEKIIKASQAMLTPVTQAIYPHVNLLMHKSSDSALFFIRKVLSRLTLASLLMSVILWFFAPHIVRILLGQPFINAIPVLRLMAFLPLVVALSNIFGVQTMLVFGMQKQFSRILILAGFFNVSLIIPMVLAWEARGAALAVMITEIVVTCTMGVSLHHRGINLFSMKA